MHRKVRIGWLLRRSACSCGVRRWRDCPDRRRVAAVAVVPMDLTW